MYSRSAPRRRHGAEFEAKVLAACDEPGASISGVALAHGLNANLVRQWRAGRGVKLAGVTVTAPARSKAAKSPVSTMIVMLPIPFGNIAPAWAISLCALGIL